ncbi:MAG TPA: FAD-dependent monooxygenase [Candidatus Limnocylindria bacterium]|nr:FAD-dependent monooxygenase [Candidatus Limnocylindria bacterium]
MDRHPRDAQVAVVGAGPIGLTLAGRLAQRGVRVLLLEQAPHHQGEGSKALCMQRETLEIWERLGIGQRVADRGIQWSVARTYFRSRELFSVKLPDGEGDHFPAFVNISQTEVEELLIGRLEELSGCQVRWGHRVTGIAQDSAGVVVRCETPEGERTFSVDYLVGTDGAHSSVRHLLGMGFPGHSHEDLFLICDIRADLPFPRERRFFFDPPWNPGRQVLVHPQPDGVWRIDWQVPPGTDADAELTNGGLDRRIRAIVGDQPYELLWMTAYHFHQRMVERFRAGRVLLAGDAAHLMSPFGARGLNSGTADAENLAWKLAAVLSGDAPERLLNSYHAERRAAAVENLAVTEATMRFMVPHGPLRRVWRDVVLRGSVRAGPLRRRVNSGRLAQPFAYAGSPVIQPGPDDPRLPAHGDVAPDAACALLRADPGERPVTRLRDLVGHGFLVLLACGERPDLAVAAAVRAARLAWPTDVRVAVVGAGTVPGGVLLLDDVRGELASIYAAAGPRAWLIRPDGHLAGSLPLHAREAVDGLPGLLARAIGASAASAPAAVRPAPRRRVSVSAGNRAGH